MLSTAAKAIVGLESFQVAFLLLHDWVPLGRLNDVAAQRGTDSLAKRFWTTVLSAAPFVAGLVFSVMFQPWTHWVRYWLWISYGLLFVGELQAWWVPYLLRPEPERVER